MLEADAVARALARAGSTVLSVDYRLVPPVPWVTRWRGAPAVRFPGPIQDCLAAWRWFHEDLQRQGWGDRPIAIGGASAGADLATVTTLRLSTEPASGPDGVALVYPLLHAELPDGDTHDPFTIGSWLARPATRWMASCFVGTKDHQHVDEAFPQAERLAGFLPTMVVIAERDPLRPSGEAFVADLRRAGAEVQLRLQPGARHGYLNRPDTEAFTETIDSLDAWLDQLAASKRSRTGDTR